MEKEKLIQNNTKNIIHRHLFGGHRWLQIKEFLFVWIDTRIHKGSRGAYNVHPTQEIKMCHKSAKKWWSHFLNDKILWEHSRYNYFMASNRDSIDNNNWSLQSMIQCDTFWDMISWSVWIPSKLRIHICWMALTRRTPCIDRERAAPKAVEKWPHERIESVWVHQINEYHLCPSFRSVLR